MATMSLFYTFSEIINAE